MKNINVVSLLKSFGFSESKGAVRTNISQALDFESCLEKVTQGSDFLSLLLSFFSSLSEKKNGQLVLGDEKIRITKEKKTILLSRAPDPTTSAGSSNSSEEKLSSLSGLLLSLVEGAIEDTQKFRSQLEDYSLLEDSTHKTFWIEDFYEEDLSRNMKITQQSHHGSNSRIIDNLRSTNTKKLAGFVGKVQNISPLSSNEDKGGGGIIFFLTKISSLLLKNEKVEFNLNQGKIKIVKDKIIIQEGPSPEGSKTDIPLSGGGKSAVNSAEIEGDDFPADERREIFPSFSSEKESVVVRKDLSEMKVSSPEKSLEKDLDLPGKSSHERKTDSGVLGRKVEDFGLIRPAFQSSKAVNSTSVKLSQMVEEESTFYSPGEDRVFILTQDSEEGILHRERAGKSGEEQNKEDALLKEQVPHSRRKIHRQSSFSRVDAKNDKVRDSRSLQMRGQITENYPETRSGTSIYRSKKESITVDEDVNEQGDSRERPVRTHNITGITFVDSAHKADSIDEIFTQKHSFRLSSPDTESFLIRQTEESSSRKFSPEVKFRVPANSTGVLPHYSPEEDLSADKNNSYFLSNSSPTKIDKIPVVSFLEKIASSLSRGEELNFHLQQMQMRFTGKGEKIRVEKKIFPGEKDSAEDFYPGEKISREKDVFSPYQIKDFFFARKQKSSPFLNNELTDSVRMSPGDEEENMLGVKGKTKKNFPITGENWISEKISRGSFFDHSVKSIEFADQIMDTVRTMKNIGQNRARFVIKSDELGKIHIRLAMEENNLMLHVHVSDSRTGDLLRDSSHYLKQNLDREGINLKEFNLDFNQNLSDSHHNREDSQAPAVSVSNQELKDEFTSGEEKETNLQVNVSPYSVDYLV